MVRAYVFSTAFQAASQGSKLNACGRRPLLKQLMMRKTARTIGKHLKGCTPQERLFVSKKAAESWQQILAQKPHNCWPRLLCQLGDKLEGRCAPQDVLSGAQLIGERF